MGSSQADVPFVCDAAAWEEAYAFMLALCDRKPEDDHTREWRREDLYDERGTPKS